MWDYIVLFGSAVAVLAAVVLLFVVFYMPQELREDLRSPELNKEYKREMRREQRWQNAIVGWRFFFIPMLGMLIVAAICMLANIPA